MEKTQPKRGLRSGFPGLDLLHLFSLSSTAFAAPLFFVLGAQAEFFVARLPAT